MRYRKSTADLTDAEKTTLVAAIKLLKDRSDDAGTTGYNKYIRLHAEAIAAKGDCKDEDCPNAAHHAPAFLPWHRAMVLNFENDLRALGPEYAEITLPYWDWANDPSGETVFTNDFMGQTYRGGIVGPPFGGDDWQCLKWIPDLHLPNGGSFQKTPTNLSRAEGGLNGMPSTPQIDRAMRYPVYDTPPWGPTSENSYRQEFERVHGIVHSAVGGFMADPLRAVNDPTFFLHHANVDRLWYAWQRANPTAHYYPIDQPDGSPPGQGFEQPLFGFDGVKVKEMWSNHMLQVAYLRPKSFPMPLSSTQVKGIQSLALVGDETLPVPIGDIPPGTAAMTAALYRFSVSFPDTDHNLKAIKVFVDPPPDSVPSVLMNFEAQFQDKDAERVFSLYAGAQILSLTNNQD